MEPLKVIANTQNINVPIYNILNDTQLQVYESHEESQVMGTQNTHTSHQ